MKHTELRIGGKEAMYPAKMMAFHAMLKQMQHIEKLMKKHDINYSAAMRLVIDKDMEAKLNK